MTVMDSAAMNIHVHVIFWYVFLILLIVYLGVELLDHNIYGIIVILEQIMTYYLFNILKRSFCK